MTIRWIAEAATQKEGACDGTAHKAEEATTGRHGVTGENKGLKLAESRGLNARFLAWNETI